MLSAFYNERIANQDYLRTADLPESVKNLIALLGYRPRPAIGAVGALAALLSPGPNFGGRAVVLPKGLQFQSKPTPGQTPQTFRIVRRHADRRAGSASRVASAGLAGSGERAGALALFDPYRRLLGARVGVGASSSGIVTGESSLLLQGAVANIGAGDLLRLRALDGTPGGPWLATVASATIGPAPSGSGQQTNLDSHVFKRAAHEPHGRDRGSGERQPERRPVEQLRQLFDPGRRRGGTTIVNLASLARQIQPGDWLLFTATGGSPPPVLAASCFNPGRDLGRQRQQPVLPPFQTVTTIASNGSTTTTNPLPIPHTMLTVSGLSEWETATRRHRSIRLGFGRRVAEPAFRRLDAGRPLHHLRWSAAKRFQPGRRNRSSCKMRPDWGWRQLAVRRATAAALPSARCQSRRSHCSRPSSCCPICCR